MLENKKPELEEIDESEELKDDGKVHFPVFGVAIIGGLVLLMVVCIIMIAIFGGK